MVAVFAHAGRYEFQSKNGYAGGTVYDIPCHMYWLACGTIYYSEYLAEKTRNSIVSKTDLLHSRVEDLFLCIK